MPSRPLFSPPRTWTAPFLYTVYLHNRDESRASTVAESMCLYLVTSWTAAVVVRQRRCKDGIACDESSDWAVEH